MKTKMIIWIARMPTYLTTWIMIFMSFPTVNIQAETIEYHGNQHEWVILLHGLGRTKRSMKAIEAHLMEKGYRVWNEGYLSTKATIEALSQTVIVAAVDACNRENATKIHFVTHSLGGILVREYLQHHTIPENSKIVMLCPPNKGSEVADVLKDFFLYRWLMGPAGQQLGTGVDSTPNQLKPVSAHIGVIAGKFSLEPWFSWIIPGIDDGKVSVDRTKLEEMTDFLVVNSSHGFIMSHPKVIEQVLHYLKMGRFRH